MRKNKKIASGDAPYYAAAAIIGTQVLMVVALTGKFVVDTIKN